MPSPISRITFFAFFFDSDCFRAWVRSCSTRRAPPYSLSSPRAWRLNSDGSSWRAWAGKALPSTAMETARERARG